MMMIEPGRVLVVVVLNAGLVKDRIARIPELIGEDQLRRIAQAIESELSGMRLDDITMVTVSTAGHKIDLSRCSQGKNLVRHPRARRHCRGFSQ